MPKRKLVTIRKVLELIPIKGADRIELAKVDGWRSVVKKGEFKVGDYGLYFEVDSFLPIEERFEFLRKGCLKKMFVGGETEEEDWIEGFRLRTVRLRGEVSHGLFMPLTAFPEVDVDTDIGIDLSERLGVLKYEPPVPAEISGDVMGGIPGIIKRTDQERIQNLIDYFDVYKGVEFEATEKEDGTSTTMFLLDNEFRVAGHNWVFKYNDKQTMWKLAEKHEVEAILRHMGHEVALQGETVGEGIQKNPMVLKGHHFHIFDIYDIEKQRYMLPGERYSYLAEGNLWKWGKSGENEENKIGHVPIIHPNVKIFDICHNIEEIIEYAKGDTVYCKGRKREGLVFKSTELIDGQVLTFKVRVEED